MTIKSTKDLLQQFPIFKDLTEYEISPIVDIARRKNFRRGTHIFMQGEQLTNVYFIYQGKVKVYKTDIHGKIQIVNVLKSGDMFPHLGFFRQDNYPAHTKALEDITLVYIPIQSFEKFLISHPETSIKLFRVLGDVIIDLQKRLEQQILHNTHEQIIMLLLRLTKQHGEQIDTDLVKISTRFTNQELANMIGSSRETVNRTLTTLKKQKCISVQGGFIIVNRDLLEDEIFY